MHKECNFKTSAREKVIFVAATRGATWSEFCTSVIFRNMFSSFANMTTHFTDAAADATIICIIIVQLHYLYFYYCCCCYYYYSRYYYSRCYYYYNYYYYYYDYYFYSHPQKFKQPILEHGGPAMCKRESEVIRKNNFINIRDDRFASPTSEDEADHALCQNLLWPDPQVVSPS